MSKYTCEDCGREVDQNHRFCSRCLAQWYAERDLDPSEVPNGDFDEPERQEF